MILFVLLSVVAGAQCGGFGTSSMPPTILTLQMILDYAEEENWKQVVLFDCIGDEDCNRPYARPLFECFSKRGILLSMKSFTETINLLNVLRVQDRRVGVVLLLDDIDLENQDNLLHKVMLRNKSKRSQILGEYTSWLVLSTKWNHTQIFDAMKDWPIGVDSDISVAMSFLPSNVIQAVLRQFSNQTCEALRNYGRTYDYARLRRSQSVSPPEATFVQDTGDASKTIMVFFLISVYKIRINKDDDLVKEKLNHWSPSRRFINKERKLAKQRSNLKQHVMNFGLQNSSMFFGSDDDSNDSVDSDHASSVESLMELISLFKMCLNVSSNITNYAFRESAQVSKESNDLVHGLTSGEIDIGASFFDVDQNRNNLLYFSIPIIRFTRSIFFKPPQTSSNIFLQPFSPKLLLCVFATLVLIVSVMEMINYVTLFIHWKEDQEHFGLGEATLWCLSIMCMQGSPWTPTTRAGKTVLLASLIFSLIIYNAYSGFITSILSVKTNSINNFTDFFNYDYTFGCSKGDDNDNILKGELRNFYVKALESNNMRMAERKGLEKTLEGNFAFFITETVAKRIFRNALMFQRCEIEELPITKSPGVLALPISISSPFKKIINVSILRMRQYGLLCKLTEMVKPRLLDCAHQLKYKQAHLWDVYGAFCILGTGALASLGLFFAERAWSSRQSLSAIQRRFTSRTRPGVPTAFRHRPHGVLLTARLPMRILGLDREIYETRYWKATTRNDQDELRRAGVLKTKKPTKK